MQFVGHVSLAHDTKRRRRSLINQWEYSENNGYGLATFARWQHIQSNDN